MELPYFFVLLIDHELHFWDKADGHGGSFRTSGRPFLSHEHNGAVFSCLSLQMNGKDLLEVHRGLHRPEFSFSLLYRLLPSLGRDLFGFFMNSQFIVVANEFIEDPLGLPLIPNWNRVLSAIPEFSDLLIDAIEKQPAPRLTWSGGRLLSME